MLVTLMLVAALAVIAFSTASLVLLESRQQTAVRRGLALRLAAIEAAQRGVAALQAGLGPDAKHDYLGTSGGLVATGRYGQMNLTGESETGSIFSRWEVSDLSMRHDVSARTVASRRASAWAMGNIGQAKLPHALAATVTPDQVIAIGAGGPDFHEPRQGPGLSWQVRGLLVDPVRGGWKTDLAGEAGLIAELGQPLASTLRGASFASSPAKGVPLVRVGQASAMLDTLPVLADLRLSLGFFNSRSDGRHRLRFHGTVVFWNRLTVPVLAGPQGRMFLVEFVGSPEVTVTNLETQSAFVVDLDDCPQEDFGIIRQGLRERGLWFWAEVTDTATYGMSGRGLLPGEVYALVNPSPLTQPQGLARILTKTTWRMERAYHGPGWKRPEPTVFLPTDRIEIAVRFRGKVGIRLRPYAGDPERDVAISDYPAKPAIALENLSFPDFLIRTNGEDYSREDSSGYVIAERRACLRVRLRPRERSELWASASRGGLSRSVWDFSVPTAAAEWVIDHPVASALDVVDHDASPLAGPLWDLRANRHDAADAGAFASVRLKDVPWRPWLSVGTLRHLEAPDATDWMERLDRAFFSAPLEVPEAGVLSHNPYLAPVVADAVIVPSKSAQGLFVLGPFNVNSRDASAWEGFLADESGAWKPDGGGPFDSQALGGRLFFTRPSGASLAKWGALTPVDLDDSALAAMSTDAFAGLAGQQSVRSVEISKMRGLARKIVELQPSHGWPYPSVEAFARSRIIEHALEATDIDAPCASASPELPIRLRAEDLLEAWAPVLTVRGDTFCVTGLAQGEGGSCVCEMVVQRFPEEHAVAFLGRRFRIISLRFRNR